MTRHAAQVAATSPVPTRMQQGRTLPAEWRVAGLDELASRLQRLDVPEDHVTLWLVDLARREVRNPARCTRRLTDADVLADVANAVAGQPDDAPMFAGHLDYDRNYVRPRARWGDRR